MQQEDSEAMLGIEVCAEGIQPCTVKSRVIYWRRYKMQEALYRGQWRLSPLQSRHRRASHSSPYLPWAAPTDFHESYQQSEISSLSKVILVLGKARSRRAPSLGCRRAESPGWFDDSPKNSAQDMMHEQVHCCDEAAKHQSPIAVAFRITWIVFAEECSSLMQNLMQIHCSTQSFWIRQPRSTRAQ